MTSHDVCRQHRRLPRPGQWPAALAAPCPGWQGARRSGARGRGEAGCGPGDLPFLQGRGAGKDVLVHHGCRSRAWGQGFVRMGRRERQAGHGASGRKQGWPASRPGILARLQHRPRRPGIAGTARPSFPVVWRAPGWLGAEPAPDFFRAGDAPRAHDAAIDDHRRGGQHA